MAVEDFMSGLRPAQRRFFLEYVSQQEQVLQRLLKLLSDGMGVVSADHQRAVNLLHTWAAPARLSDPCRIGDGGS